MIFSLILQTDKTAPVWPVIKFTLIPSFQFIILIDPSLDPEIISLLLK